jgi:hypothetical protein
MANTKIVYGTILPDISLEETIIFIFLRAVLETLKIRTTGAQTSISSWKRTISKKLVNPSLCSEYVITIYI